jgi:hypothetical protein
VHGRADIREVSTGEAKAFRKHAHSRLPRALLAGPVEVLATYYLETLSSDGTNRTKALHDALQEFLFYNDCQVAEVHEVYLFADKHHPPGVVFEVVPATDPKHAERARRLAASKVQQRANEAAQPRLFAEPTEGGPSKGTDSSPVKPSDARAGAVLGAPGPRAVFPEPLQQRLNRIARPAVVSHRPPDDEPPEAA